MSDGKTCKDCVFYVEHRPDMPKVQYCTNRNFPILNPEKGCDKYLQRRKRK